MQGGLDLGDGVDQRRPNRSRRRWPGAAASRPAGARRVRPRVHGLQRAGEQRVAGRRSACVRGREKPPGLDHAAEDEGVEQLGSRRPSRARPAPGRGRRRSTTVPPPRPRVVRTMPAARSAAMASRSVARETPICSASSRSGGSVLPYGIDAEPDRRGQPLDAALEGVPSPGRARGRLARRSTVDSHRSGSSSASPLVPRGVLVLRSVHEVLLAPACQVTIAKTTTMRPRSARS